METEERKRGRCTPITMPTSQIHLEMGQVPPFLTRNITRTPGRAFRRPIESECAMLTVVDDIKIRSMRIRALIKNRNVIVPVRIYFGRPVVLMSCFDEVHLFLSDTTGTYYAQFHGCRNWEIKSVRATRIGSEHDAIQVPIHLSNLKHSNEYHYNIVQVSNRNRYTIAVESTKIELQCFQCPLCFRIFSCEDQLIRHVKILHLGYELVQKNNLITLMKTYCTDENQHNGIEFYSDSFTDDTPDVQIQYVDFYTGFSVECSVSSDSRDQEAVFYEIKKDVRLKSENVKKYNSAVDTVELVSSLSGAKKKPTAPGFEVFFIQPPRIVKESKNYKRFTPAHKCFVTALDSLEGRFLDQRYIKNNITKDRTLSYMKNRSTDTIKYPLKSYSMLIEREFDTFDYSDVISAHVNQGVDEYFRSGSMSYAVYNVMRTWNRAVVERGSVLKALKYTVDQFGVVKETIELIEVLYHRGMINSKEIMEILEKSVKH